MTAKPARVSIYVQIGDSDAYSYIGTTREPADPADVKARFLAANPHKTATQVQTQRA